MRQHLAALEAIAGVRSVLLAGQDGLIVASAGPEVDDGEMKAALSAAVYYTIQRAIAQIDVGSLRDAIIQTSSHSIQMMGLDDLLLVVVSERSINVGLVRLEMQRAVQQLVGRPELVAAR